MRLSELIREWPDRTKAAAIVTAPAWSPLNQHGFSVSLGYYKFLTINEPMKERTQSLIFLLVLGVAGYFAYQHFGIPWLEGNNSAKSTFNMTSLPEACQRHGENFKNSYSRNDVTAKINGYAKNLRKCLRQSGFSASQIDEVIDGIKDSS